MRRFITIIGIFVLLGQLFIACGDEDLIKFDRVSGVKNWEPNLVSPVAEGTFTVWDLVEQSGDNLVKENNEILIRHLQKDIYSLKVEDILQIPSEIADFAASVSLPALPSLPEVQTISFQPEPVKIRLDEGEIYRIKGAFKLAYSLPSLPFNYTATVTFPNLTVKGNPVELIAAGGTYGEKSFEEVLFDMTDSPNQLAWNIQLSIDGGQSIPAQQLSLVFKMKQFQFEQLEGKLDPQTFAIPADDFDMGVDFWENFDGEIHFEDPKVSLIVNNYGLGVPVTADMNFVAYGNGKSLALQTKNGYMPQFAGWTLGEEKIKEIQYYDRENSNINEILSLPPKDRIEYAGEVLVNPEKKDVVCVKGGIVTMDALVEIPLYLRANDIIFNDTIDDIDIGEADKIMEAQISVQGTNYIPLELSSGNLYLLDAGRNCIDSVKINADGKQNFLDAPVVNASGEVTAPAEGICTIPLSEGNIKNLEETSYIVISVKAATSNRGEVPIRLKADATLNVILRLEAKLDLNDL